MRTLHWFGTTVIAIFAATAVAAQPSIQAAPAEGAALQRFDAAIAEYLRTHRFPEPLDLETLCLPEQAAYAGARFDEPPAPREGDVFKAVIRSRIAALNLPTKAGPPRALVVAVGQQLAAGRTAPVPKVIAAVLPPIPDDLGYRLTGADLVLLDLRTYVVVDAVRGWRVP
jgi:hypothetical protein